MVAKLKEAVDFWPDENNPKYTDAMHEFFEFTVPGRSVMVNSARVLGLVHFSGAVMFWVEIFWRKNGKLAIVIESSLAVEFEAVNILGVN